MWWARQRDQLNFNTCQSSSVKQLLAHRVQMTNIFHWLQRWAKSSQKFVEEADIELSAVMLASFKEFQWRKSFKCRWLEQLSGIPSGFGAWRSGLILLASVAVSPVASLELEDVENCTTHTLERQCGWGNKRRVLCCSSFMPWFCRLCWIPWHTQFLSVWSVSHQSKTRDPCVNIRHPIAVLASEFRSCGNP